MEQSGDYKNDLDISRSERFSTLYIIGAKIGLGCLTYFMVGLLVSMVYVLSDMDYFTLNGQFRTQRFFTDDGYYYTKQLVTFYGILGFIITMFVGPIGKLQCMIVSLSLTLGYMSICIFMLLLNNSRRLGFLMRSLSLISFLSHSLLCNFIFVLFDPNYFIIHNKSRKGTSNSNNSSSAKAQTLYRIMAFVSGYFLGLPLISYLFSKLTISFTGSLTDNILIDAGMDISKLLFLVSIISLISTLFTIFQFVFDIASITDLNNLSINNIYYLLNNGHFAWAPFMLISNNVMKNTLSYFINIEILLFMWFLNPMVVSLIPYSVGTHFQFHTFSHLNKILYSIMFVIILVIFVNQDLLSNCVSIINELNMTIFNILYTDGCIQLNDDHLRPTPISTTPHPNYNSNNSFADMRNLSINSEYNKFDSNNSISLPGLVLYPYSCAYSLDTTNNDKKLLSIINKITTFSRSFDYNIRNKSEENVVSILEHFSFFTSLKFCNEDIEELLSYLPSHLQNQILSLLTNMICEYDSNATAVYTLKINSELKKSEPQNVYFAFAFSSFLLIYKLIYLGSIESGTIDKEVFKSSSKSLVKILVKLNDLLRQHQTNTSSLDKELDSGSNLQSTPLLLRQQREIVLTILSHMSTVELSISLQRHRLYFFNVVKILCMVKCTKKCDCGCYKELEENSNKCFYGCLKKLQVPNYDRCSINYYTFKIETNGNPLCLCLIIECKLIPIVLWSIYYIISIIFDVYSSYNRQFTKYNYSEKYTTDTTRTVLSLIDLIEKLICRLVKDSKECTSCQAKTNGCGICSICIGSQKKCCCICLCKDEFGRYYTFYSSIFVYISSLLEYVIEFENNITTFPFQNISILIAELESSFLTIGLTGKPAIDLKECKCVCISKGQSTCTCKCAEGGSSECCCTKQRDKNCCCCIICKNCKIICYGICLGCCICCLCSVKECQCHKNLKDSCNGSNGVCGTGKCLCQQICEKIKEIKECSCNEGNVCCKTLFESIENGCSNNGNTCSCQKIFEKMSTVPKQCKDNLKKVCESITTKFNQACSKEKKCCGKLVVKSILLLYNISKLLSFCYLNESKMQYILCCCNGNESQQSENKKPSEYLGKVYENCKNILVLSKNNRIGDLTHKLVSQLYKSKELNTQNVGINVDNNKHISYFGSGSRYYRLTSNRFIIPICLIILALFMRLMFDDFIKIDIIGQNKHISKIQTDNFDKRTSKYLNETRNTQFDINKNGNIVMGNDLGNDHSNENSVNDYQYHENQRYNNTKYYAMIFIVSILSALYSNMTIRNMYNRLNLEYNMWSYLINMVLMFGLIFTLLSKYCIHVFDFVGVLDKYGMNLSKSDSFIDYVDRSDSKLIDHFSSPVKNMMTFGLFKSMTKDLRSLTMFKDVSKISGSTTTYSKLRHKLYPYKDMSKPVRRITKYCDKCQHSLCKIHKNVIKSLGNKESIDIVSVLDFLSYSMILNNESFKDQYKSYFSGDETYMAWALGKKVNNNTFLAEYYRYYSLNKIEFEIKQLINGDHRLGANNLLLLWQSFSRNEVYLISVKSICDNKEVQMINDQRETLKKLYYEQYLKSFYNYQKYITSKLFSAKVVGRDKFNDIKSTLEFRDILNKNILNKNKLNELTSKYFDDEYEKKLTSLSIPTITCNIKGNKQEVKNRVNEFCDNWLERKLDFCKHMNNLECEKAVNVAYNTITSLLDKPGDLYKNIYDLLSNIDLDFAYDLKQVLGDRPTLGPRCRDCESMSMFYITQYFSLTHTNIDKMLTPLGMYLSWHGTPIDKHHLNKCSHTE